MQTGRSVIALEPIVRREAPDWIFAVGDADAALAAALVGRKNGTPVAHLEAGLRTGDDTSPEEINRLLTDRLSDVLFTAESETGRNLRREGIPDDRIHFVGNVVADAVERLKDRARALDLPAVMELETESYLLALFRRERNVADAERLETLLGELDAAAMETGRPTLLVMEPRLAASVHRHRLEHLLPPLNVIEPVGYVELVALIRDAALVLTDGGEVRDSATLLGVPSITVRTEPLRGQTISQGLNRVCAGDAVGLADAVDGALKMRRKPQRPELWDGHAAERIAEVAFTTAPATV
jgi:UDP-N-acetylglucosamine 2-epimerase (non-hydrolysing)